MAKKLYFNGNVITVNEKEEVVEIKSLSEEIMEHIGRRGINRDCPGNWR